MKTRTCRSFPTHPATTEVTKAVLVQLLRLYLDVPFAGRFLLPVLLYPGLEGLARCRVPACECERRDIGVGHIHLCRRIGRDNTNERVSEGRTGTPIEEVADDLRAVLLRDRNVAAIVEGLLQRLANLGVTCQRRNPALEILFLAAFDVFQLVGAVLPQLFDLQMLLLLCRHCN